MYKIENRWPIRAFVLKIAIPRSRHGGLGLVVWSDRKIFLTSYVALAAHIMYKIENRRPIAAFVPEIAIPSSGKAGLGLVV